MTAVAHSDSFILARHPQSQTSSTGRIDVVLGQSCGSVTLKYSLMGAISSLCVPGPRPSCSASGLWQHTCFEIFVMAETGAGYREFNFSPSGEWAVYDFRSYRDGGELEIELAPGIRVQRTANRLELTAAIRRDFLPPGRRLKLGLAAVVEDAGGELSYWALHHPPGKPDFHHNDAFAAYIEPI